MVLIIFYRKPQQEKYNNSNPELQFDKNVASLANDGVLITTLELCGYTNPGKSKAWLQVDLDQAFSITRVKVYYRKEGIYLKRKEKH